MFYHEIANNYDYIFPKNPMQLNCIEHKHVIKPNEKILDIGCATGSLTSLLFDKTKHVIGLDLNDALLKLAKVKYPTIDFCNKNMLELHDFDNDSFDRIVSFGNTLVHLSSVDEVFTFFKKVFEALKKDGQFTVQIINYNRIYNDKIKSLPLIENEVIRFDRSYELFDNHVAFNTELMIKENNEVLNNSINLLNLTQGKISELLGQVGFKDLEFYGNLKCHPITDDSIPLIFTCFK